MKMNKHIKKTAIAGALLGSVLFADSALAETHTVKSGDYLSKIGNQYGVSVSTIMDINNLNSTIIHPGQVLKLDNSTVKSTTTYTVQSGDYLSKIASKHNTTNSKLLELNSSISNPNYLYIGQRITVPSSNSSSKSHSSSATTHTVKSGDYLSAIANKYGVSYKSLLQANPQISNPSLIHVGQSINIPTGSSTPTQVVTPTQLSDKVITEGKKYLGARYLYGASTSRTDAFDCSSFTVRAFSAAGVNLPRVSRDQAKVGSYVSRSNLQKGDLIFFDTSRDGVINHVGIYLGNNKMLNAANKYGVSIVGLDLWWGDYYVTGRRVL